MPQSEEFWKFLGGLSYEDKIQSPFKHEKKYFKLKFRVNKTCSRLNRFITYNLVLKLSLFHAVHPHRTALKAGVSKE